MEIKGIIAAMATAMYEDGSINESEIRNQVNRHIRAGVDGIFCLGTNGEAYIQSEDEKLRVIETVVKAADGRVPVYAGTGMPGTADTIRLSKKAKELGVDVLPSSAPTSPLSPRMSCITTTPSWPERWICPSSCTICPPVPAIT